MQTNQRNTTEVTIMMMTEKNQDYSQYIVSQQRQHLEEEDDDHDDGTGDNDDGWRWFDDGNSQDGDGDDEMEMVMKKQIEAVVQTLQF